MAAHIMCHSNEVLPNTFPPPRPSARDHGMMSEYEAAIIMQHNTHTGIPTGMGATSNLDLETMPVLNKPTPTFSQSYDITDFYDPALCVTPEKKTATKREPVNRGSDEGVSMKPRNSQKVRFDNFVEVKQMSPDACTRGAVLIERDSPDPALNLASRIDPSESDISDQGSSVSDDNHSATADYEPISVFASDLQPSSKHSWNSRENVQTIHSASKMVQSTPYILSEKPEHVLARPELNSTLRVGKEIQQLEDAELDVTVAVQKKLKDSLKLKTAITEKISAKVNTMSKQFQGLVSVEVCEQDLISNTEKQKAKAKHTVKTTKLENTIVPAPDILEFMTSDLQQQTASLTLEGLPPRDDGPRTAHLSRAFDVYRHIRTWEGW